MDPQSRVCPVCWDEDAYDASGAILGVGCNRGHAVCVSCARKLAYVAGPCFCKDKQSCFCTGLVMPCPLCRTQCHLQPRHVLALLRGSWEEAQQSAIRQSPSNARFGTPTHLVTGC